MVKMLSANKRGFESLQLQAQSSLWTIKITCRRINQVSLVVSLLACLLIVLEAPHTIEGLELSTIKSSETNQQIRQHNKDKEFSNNRAKNSLEAELDSIVQQHDSNDLNDRSLAEAIISRLMVDNLAPIDNTEDLPSGSGSGAESSGAGADGEQQQQQQPSRYYPGSQTGLEALRNKKLLSMVQAYEAMLNGGEGNPLEFPMLPSGQAATSKRATKLVGNYLQQRHAIAGNSNNPNGYGRSSFDFGLGKRPDLTGGASSNILRFSDSLGGGGGNVQAVNGAQFGKRPSAHRYDFGLGKRVASSAYPRYDFGLGKRAPNRIRYDFGLGK